MSGPIVHFQAAVRCAGTTALVACLVAVPAMAQQPAKAPSLSVHVIGDAGMPVAGASVQLLIPAARQKYIGETDDAGLVKFMSLPAGSGSVVVRRIGYRPDSTSLVVSESMTEPVRVTLQRAFVELNPIRVVGRRDVSGPMEGFYRRLANHSGGHFLTRQDIEQRNVSHMTDVFRLVPGARLETRNGMTRIRMRNSNCAPVVWLDGMPMLAGEVDLDSFAPQSLEAIEIYGGPASVPVEFQSNRVMSSACGTIILWSRRGEFRPRKRKKNEPTPAALAEKMLTEGSAFLANDVDFEARPDSNQLERPMYPDSLLDAMVPGTVVVEFVVDSNGKAIMETFSPVTTSHRQFIEPVRRVIQSQTFIPARRKGFPVRQLIQLPFHFIPDSTARQRR